VGSIALSLGYVISTIGVLLDTPASKNDPVVGVAKVFGYAGAGWLQGVAAVGIAVVIFVAFSVYQSAYSRLVFVPGLGRHLPRVFTHLNARTRNPVTALLIQGVRRPVRLREVLARPGRQGWCDRRERSRHRRH
jgi:amino acid transporter